MKKSISLTLFPLCALFLPIVLLAQIGQANPFFLNNPGGFTGFHDNTVNNNTFKSQDGSLTGDPSVTTDPNNFSSTSNSVIGDTGAGIGAGSTLDTSSVKNASNPNSGQKCSVDTKSIRAYVDYIGCGIGVAIIPFMLAIAVVTFTWGIVMMLTNSANEEAQKKGRDVMLYGILGFTIITTMYALVGILRRTIGFGFNSNDNSQYEQLKDNISNLK